MNFFCSYNIISSLFNQFGLVIKHDKSEVFYFLRSTKNIYLPSLDLIPLDSSLLHLKYTQVSFSTRNSHFNITFIIMPTKPYLSLNMKMLENSTRGLSLTYKQLLYKTCILLITLYEFQLQYFKRASLYQLLKKLKKIQRRVVLWITGTFYTSLTQGVETIAGLIPIHFHLKKIIG